MTRAEQIAAVLAEHVWRDVQGDYEISPYFKHFGCSCGWHQDITGMSGYRSWLAGHRAHVSAALDAALAAQGGERGGADIQLGHRWRAVGPNAAELWNECSYCRAKEGLPAATRPCPLAPKGERGEAEVAAAVEAVLPVGPRPFADAYFIGAHDLAARIRAALADPAGALAKVKAEVLRAAADEARVVFVSPTFSLWLRERAERIEAQP